MPLTQAQCQQFSDHLGRRPFDWDKKISEDRKPHSYTYTGMYRTETWQPFTGTTHLHEKIYVTRPNDPGLWPQFTADPCLSAPCNTPRRYVCHGVDQLRYDEFAMDYQTPVFCLDQLNSIEEGIQKVGAIARGYKDLPEHISSDFIRQLTIRKAGTSAQNAGLFICGPQDAQGNPTSIDVADSMFAISQGGFAGSVNTLMVNLNALGGLTAISITTTAALAAAMGQLTMEYLANQQEDLSAQGYHDRESMIAGKFNLLTDATTRRRLLVANPALTQMYSAADFAKGGAFYSYGVSSGCGDWLFKEDMEQMRFRFRGDLDGKDLQGNALTNAIWIEQVQTYENVAATFGFKPVYSFAWKNAPIRLYHVYNRDARTVYVADITSVNDEMKFGLARSFLGNWKWYSPTFFKATDPKTGFECEYRNEKQNMGFWLGEFRIGEKTVYPEIERIILALGEPQPYVRVPRTNTAPNAPTSTSDYQQVLAYCNSCGDPGGYVGPFTLPPED